VEGIEYSVDRNGALGYYFLVVKCKKKDEIKEEYNESV
jgi:hypothetical protein